MIHQHVTSPLLLSWIIVCSLCCLLPHVLLTSLPISVISFWSGENEVLKLLLAPVVPNRNLVPIDQLLKEDACAHIFLLA